LAAAVRLRRAVVCDGAFAAAVERVLVVSIVFFAVSAIRFSLSKDISSKSALLYSVPANTRL
jgi:hypothetical protein